MIAERSVWDREAAGAAPAFPILGEWQRGPMQESAKL